MQRSDALTQLLVLAVAAPTDVYADRLSAIADHLAEEVNQCKAAAAAFLDN
jgi:hypothetical protein